MEAIGPSSLGGRSIVVVGRQADEMLTVSKILIFKILELQL